MTGPSVKGWCPGAYRPMLSGDGLVLRLRPRMGRLTRAELEVICDLAEEYGNGLMSVTNRANLQMRGLNDTDHPRVLEKLGKAGLLDADAKAEARRNIVVDPFWHAGDMTDRLARALAARLAEFPTLPAKAGIAIDCGAEARLGETSADLRFELSKDGTLMLRADGAATGRLIHEREAVDAALTLARLYAERLTDGRGRLKDVLPESALPAEWLGTEPRAQAPAVQPGQAPLGQIIALPFGQISARALRHLSAQTAALRLTPWRMVIAECATGIDDPEVITSPDNPLLHVDACPGAPRCPAAHADTHALARRLAPRIKGRLHVSGCVKGCARQAPAAVTIIGTPEGFDIVRAGNAQARPTRSVAREHDLLAEFP